MDSSDEDTFITAPSQPPTQRELDFDMALAIITNLSKTLNEAEAIGAETQTADSQCSVTQVEPRATAALVEPYLAKAKNKLLKAKKVLKARKELEAEKVQEAKRALEEKKAPKVLAAVVKEPPKTKSEYHVTKSEIEELATTLNRVSLERSDTRLAIAYPRDRSQYLCGDAVVEFEPTIEENALFGILQRKEDVDFCLVIPHCEPDHIWITYDPMSDNCSLTLKIDTNSHVNNSTYRLFMINLGVAIKQLDSSNMLLPGDWEKLTPLGNYIIQPGVWRILVKNANEESSTIDILLLKKTFNVFISGLNNTTKRAATDYIPNTRSSKRLKMRATQRAIGNQTTGKHDIIQTPQNTPTLLDLQNGNIAIIRSQGQPIYSIERIEAISIARATSVFSCRVSTIPGKVVAAKVLRYSYYGIRTAEIWRREKKALEILDHVRSFSFFCSFFLFLIISSNSFLEKYC